MWNLLKRFRRPERIYLDYAGATPVLPAAMRALESATSRFGNPGAIHADGVEAQRSLSDSRERIARELGCKAREIVFVSGGTEANNLAILGFARAIMLGKAMPRSSSKQAGPNAYPSTLSGTHWIVSSIEHPSVLECFAEIERLGGAVDFVDPNEHGIIRPEAVSQLLRKETVFVSIGWGNGEIGVIQPLSRIAKAIRVHEAAMSSSVLLHSDAGQAPLYDAANVHSLGVDLLSLDSGKLYGPRGIGCLFLNNRVALARTMLGGGQERGLRAGTENVALAAGFAAAFACVARERKPESKRLLALRNMLIDEVLARIPAETGVPAVIINGDRSHAMPHIVNVSIAGINSEYLVLALDHEGVSVSTKSACREGEAQESHVVKELGGDAWRARNTIRFSLGRDTRAIHVKKAAETLSLLVHRERVRAA